MDLAEEGIAAVLAVVVAMRAVGSAGGTSAEGSELVAEAWDAVNLAEPIGQRSAEAASRCRRSR